MNEDVVPFKNEGLPHSNRMQSYRKAIQTIKRSGRNNAELLVKALNPKDEISLFDVQDYNLAFNCPIKPGAVYRLGMPIALARYLECIPDNYDVLAIKPCTLTEEQARVHCISHVGKTFYNELVGFWMSYPSIQVVLTVKTEKTVQDELDFFRNNVVGNTDPLHTKKGQLRHPTCLGWNKFFNGCHCPSFLSEILNEMDCLVQDSETLLLPDVYSILNKSRQKL